MSQEPLHSQVGPTIKSYGRFHLKKHELSKGEQASPAYHYWITLDNGDGNSENLGLISIQESTLPGILDYLHIWIRRRYIDIHIAKRMLSQPVENDEVRANIQKHLEYLEHNYSQVVSALRELAPDYQPDESIPNLPQAPSEEEPHDLPGDLDS